MCLHPPDATLSTSPGNQGPEIVLKLQRPRQRAERGTEVASVCGASRLAAPSSSGYLH